MSTPSGFAGTICDVDVPSISIVSSPQYGQYPDRYTERTAKPFGGHDRSFGGLAVSEQKSGGQRDRLQ